MIVNPDVDGYTKTRNHQKTFCKNFRKTQKKHIENHKNTASKYEEYGGKVFSFILPAVSDFSPATVS